MFKRFRSLAVSNIKLASLAIEVHDASRALTYAEQAQAASAALSKLPEGDTRDVKEVISGAYSSLGRARAMLGKTDAAKESYAASEVGYREMIKTNPLDADARVNLARAELYLGDLELNLGNPEAAITHDQNAESIFEELIKKDKINPELKWYHANTEYAIGRALKLDAKPDEAKIYFSRSAATYQVLLQSDPKNIQRKIEVMLAGAQLNQAEPAVAYAREVEGYAPQHAGKLFSVALAYAILASSPSGGHSSEQRDKSYSDQAVRVLRKALQSDFRDSWTLQHIPELKNLPSLNSSAGLADPPIHRKTQYRVQAEEGEPLVGVTSPLHSSGCMAAT
jgi:tetratricopeptide (TPR) repeat protein